LPDLAEIVALPRGAKFHRADMHIHSYGASHDVRDATMTPEAIVRTALAQGLGVIAITDHNEISNVDAALKAATGSSLLVVPGVELSTPEGHLLAFLPTLEALQRFYGRLDIVDRGGPNSRCQNSILDCLNQVHAAGGFGILAHVDAEKGFETENPGARPHKIDVICHSALVGIELRTSSSTISYADVDPEADRARAGKNRVERLGLGARQFLARVLFSDSHALSALGRNAEGDKKVTRIKMDKPSFEALRIALQDADARVRIEELIPPAVPHILGIGFSGGFLNGQVIHLSPNLNCIIGGRGTGKSTTFEALRCLQGRPSDSSVVDSEVWPAELSLFWEDAAGQQHTLLKLVGEDLANVDDPDGGPVEFAIDSYGQGETARISRRAQTDPLALLDYLDKFVDLGEARAVENAARDDLLGLQGKIEEAEEKVALIPQYERNLATTRQQLKASEKANAGEVIQLQRRLAEEREIQRRIVEDWQAAQAAMTGADIEKKIQALKELAKPGDVVVGAAELQVIIAGVATLETHVADAGKLLKREVSVFDAVLKGQIRLWRSKDTEALRVIETKRKELEAQGVRLDMGFISKLAKDEASYKKSLEALGTWKPHLTELKRERSAVLKRRWTARDRVAVLRDAYGRRASETLRTTLSDLMVRLKFVRNGCAPEAANQIQQVMSWRTSQVQRATLLTEKLTVPALLEVIEKRNTHALTTLALDDGTRPFNAHDATEILDRLGEPKVKFALERCEVHDLPRLQVTKNIDGRYITREFSKLSLGQQQSILLALVLSSDSSDPLIIDQPEDNLDGEFIYSSLVPVLRRAKERRQIVIVTHNANIAVLGDAEQIIVLKSQSDWGIITARGSIDDPETRDSACNILEGAREAFLRRAKIYGLLH
jgi:ABC-type lipoprotein export system ATPase subunit